MEGDTAPLRNAASQWSLAGDKQLLGVLQNIHERLVSRCQDTNKKLGEMATALEDATVDLHNVNNKFMALSNTQFIESRVYDDDVEVAPPVETKEPKIPADATSEIEKIKLGLKVLESMHEPLHILHDTDSESDEDDEISRMVLKPKDPYSHRPLPYIIGSYAWQNKWHAGLLPEDSDTDSSVMKQDSREEYSDSEPESIGNIQTDKLHVPERTVSTASSDMISEELPSTSPVVKPSPSDIAAELARRLGGHTTKTSEPEMEYTPPVPTTKKIYKPEKPATSTIFSDEPPPLEHSYSDKDDYSQEEDDDIFAELNKNKPFAQNNIVQSRVTEDLFGGLGKNEKSKNDGDTFGDFKEPPEPVNQKSTLFSDESEPELFAEKSQPKPTKHDTPQEFNSVKKPVGGISLFGNKGTESIGAAILKRNQRQSSTEEDIAREETVSQKQETKKEKDIFDDLFAKSEKEQRKMEIKVERVEKEVKKEVKKEKKVDLFSDNIFDDIDDIFTSNIPKVPIKEASKNQKSIFDDEDDLFSNVTLTKDTKSEVKTSSNIKKSIFDSDDELFSEKTVTKPIGNQNTNVKSVTEKVSETAKSIFDDTSDSDVFSDVQEPVSKKNPVYIFGNSKEDVVNSNVIFEKVTDNITDKTFVESVMKPEDKMTDKSMLDEDDDIFKTIPSTNSQPSKPLDTITNEVHANNVFENTKQNINDESKKIAAKPIFDDELQNDFFANSSKQDLQKPTMAKVRESLFDNDSEEELFLNNSKQNYNHEAIQNEPKSKSIDEVGDNVSLNTGVTHQSSIKTSEDLQNVNTQKLLFNKGNDTRKNKQEPNKNDVMNIVNEEDIDDLFTKDKNLEIVTDISKEETDCIVVEDDNDEWEDDLFKNNNTQEIIPTHVNSTKTEIESTFDKKLGEHLFMNINENSEQMNVSTMTINESLDKTPKILENDNLIAEKNESEISISDNTNDNNINAAQDTLFLDKTNIIIEKPPLFTEQNDSSFNKSDIFSDIFSEPPEFKKPKEPKKSKNVNALFDDDSDDEALFFKKNDPTLDDKPEYSLPTAENKLFGLFHDEPPALDVDFVQKTSKLSNLDDAPKDQVDFNNDFVKSKSIVKEKEPITPESPISENEFLPPVAYKITDQSIDPKKDSSNRIGKLKTMNFNINVNALLPGASPKKAQAIEKAKEPTHPTSEVEIRTKDSSKQEIEPKIVKSISFEGKPESQVLDNSLSKERAKIQVKRRPSTRRARKEAVRKSAIDFGDDSADHSSSIEDVPKTGNTENDFKIDSENVTDSLSYDSIVDVEDLKPDILPLDPNVTEKSISETEPRAAEVKTKTVYILNDEDIFDIAPKSDTKQTLNTKVLNIVDDDLFQTRLEPSKPENTSKLDEDEKILTTEGDLQAENIGNNFNADVETLFTIPKSKHLNIIDDDDDDLFKIKTNADVNTLGKAYKDSKSTDAEDESLFTAQYKNTRDYIDTGKVKSTENLEKTSLVVGESIKSQTGEIKDKIENADKIDCSIEKPKKVKKASIFDLSDEENELFNKNAKSITKSVFDSDSDEELFNKKGASVKKEAIVKERDVKVKVDVKASLFGDDDDDDLFGIKTKKSDDTASHSIQPSTKGAGIKTTEPVFDDPLSLFGGEAD